MPSSTSSGSEEIKPQDGKPPTYVHANAAEVGEKHHYEVDDDPDRLNEDEKILKYNKNDHKDMQRVSVSAIAAVSY